MRLRAPGMITRKVTQPITVKVRNIMGGAIIISQYCNSAYFQLEYRNITKQFYCNFTNNL